MQGLHKQCLQWLDPLNTGTSSALYTPLEHHEVYLKQSIVENISRSLATYNYSLLYCSSSSSCSSSVMTLSQDTVAENPLGGWFSRMNRFNLEIKI